MKMFRWLWGLWYGSWSKDGWLRTALRHDLEEIKARRKQNKPYRKGGF